MFGFGKKTWKDERAWLSKASELLDRDYNRWFLASSMVYSDSKERSPKTLKELNKFVKDSSIHNMYMNAKMSERFYSADDLYYQLERLDGDNIQKLKTIFTNMDPSVFESIEKDIGFQENPYPENYGNTSIEWLDQNKTKSSILEDFRKRQSSFIQSVNAQIYLYLSLRRNLEYFVGSLRMIIENNAYWAYTFNNNHEIYGGKNYYEDYEKIQENLAN